MSTTEKCPICNEPATELVMYDEELMCELCIQAAQQEADLNNELLEQSYESEMYDEVD